METLWQDIKFGLRTLSQNRSFTLIAVITLMLGIGANTAIFSIVNGVLLRPLPYYQPDRLVFINESNAKRGLPQYAVSPPDYLDWQAQSQSFSMMSAYAFMVFNYTGNNGAQRLDGAAVSSKTFELFGEKPVVGRFFLPEEEQSGKDNVVVLSEAFWKRQFGGDSSIIGKQIRLNSHEFTVAGVVSANFQFPFDGQVWKPLVLDGADDKNRKNYSLGVVARLKDNVTLSQANTEMELIAQRLQQAYPDSNTGWSATVSSLNEQYVGNLKPSLLTLLAAVFIILLIACVNVASLLLARLSVRQKEIGVRMALGATRWRMLRQLLTESLLLGLIGGIGGLVLAKFSLALILQYLAMNLPRVDQISLDNTVLLFTFLLSMITGVIFGIIPAWQTINTDVNAVLKESGRSNSSGRALRRFQNLLVISEVVLSLVLTIGAGLLIRSFFSLRQVDPGFVSTGVLVNTQLVLPPSKYGKDRKGVLFFQQLIDRVKGLPGVASVGGITALPLQRNSSFSSYRISDRPLQSDGGDLAAVANIVTMDYFNTMGIPLLQGREFNEFDGEKSTKVAMINQTLAQRDFPNQNPIGQHILLLGQNKDLYEIVGVVGDSRQFGLDSKPQPEIFTNYLQQPVTFMYLLVKSSGDLESIAQQVKSQVEQLDPDQPVGHRTLDKQYDNAIAAPRFYMLLLGSFASIALLLAIIGIYGVMSYSVSLRTQEIGIRMALGARQFDVLLLILKQGLTLTIIGVVIGLVLSLAVTRLMSNLLFGVTATDPITYLVLSVGLVIIALAACYFPAHRAMKVDPMIALRQE